MDAGIFMATGRCITEEEGHPNGKDIRTGMEVVYHLGAPCTDNDLLVQSLLKNRAMLAREGIVVPTPGRYRALVRDASRSLKGMPATPDMQEALLDAIIDEPEVDRLILSDPRFVCINRLVVQGPQIWPMIERQTDALRALWPERAIEFFIGIRNPATLIPALFKASRFSDFAEFTENMQPAVLAWSEMIRRLRNAHPDAHIVVWCNEDTPLIWGEVLREMAGVGDDSPLEGVDDLVQGIMQPAGFARMQTYLSENPPRDDVQRRRIVAAFLERYAKDEAIEETLDLPGWTEDLIEQMSTSYEDDIDVIDALQNVTMIQP